MCFSRATLLVAAACAFLACTCARQAHAYAPYVPHAQAYAAYANPALAPSPLDTFRLGNNIVKPDLTVYSQVLSTASGAVAPFYHAHGSLHMLPSLTINDAVSFRLRTVAEVWSFSDAYNADNNQHFWAKPSIRARINTGGLGDSLVVLGGDLWRIKNGQGLALDYFEALGVNVQYHIGKVVFEATTAGYGWTGIDDIYMANVMYDSLVRFNVFANFGSTFFNIDPSGDDRLVLSVDAQTTEFYGFRAYAEGGLAVGQAFGALAGIVYNLRDTNTSIKLTVEGRLYEDDFFDGHREDYPYLNSITALDKPVNTYLTWINEEDLGLYFRLQARQTIYKSLFIQTDTEYHTLIDGLFTETALGFNVMSGVDITAGFLSKLFTLYTGFPNFSTDNHMFRSHAEGFLKISARM